VSRELFICWNKQRIRICLTEFKRAIRLCFHLHLHLGTVEFCQTYAAPARELPIVPHTCADSLCVSPVSMTGCFTMVQLQYYSLSRCTHLLLSLLSLTLDNWRNDFTLESLVGLLSLFLTQLDKSSSSNFLFCTGLVCILYTLRKHD